MFAAAVGERERKKKLHWKRQKHQAAPTLDGRPSVLSSWLEREREKRAARVVGRRLKQKRQNDGLVALLWCSYEEDVEIYALKKTHRLTIFVVIRSDGDLVATPGGAKSRWSC